jgi:hypothetical protein
MTLRGKRKRNSIAEQFIAHTVRMLESPAFQIMSLSARRVLARIEIEHAHHGGNDNGKLPVTFDDFVEYGVHRHAIGPAIRESEALGFVEVTERGYAGNAEFRAPNKFRLTYLHAGNAKPTNEWERIQTIDDAEVIAKKARFPVKATRQKNKKSSVGFCPISMSKAITETPKSQCRKPPLQSWFVNRHYFLYLGSEADRGERDA